MKGSTVRAHTLFTIDIRARAGGHEREYKISALDRYDAMCWAAYRWERETGRDDSFVGGCREDTPEN